MRVHLVHPIYELSYLGVLTLEAIVNTLKQLMKFTALRHGQRKHRQLQGVTVHVVVLLGFVLYVFVGLKCFLR